MATSSCVFSLVSLRFLFFRPWCCQLASRGRGPSICFVAQSLGLGAPLHRPPSLLGRMDPRSLGIVKRGDFSAYRNDEGAGVEEPPGRVFWVVCSPHWHARQNVPVTFRFPWGHSTLASLWTRTMHMQAAYFPSHGSIDLPFASSTHPPTGSIHLPVLGSHP